MSEINGWVLVSVGAIVAAVSLFDSSLLFFTITGSILAIYGGIKVFLRRYDTVENPRARDEFNSERTIVIKDERQIPTHRQPTQYNVDAQRANVHHMPANHAVAHHAPVHHAPRLATPHHATHPHHEQQHHTVQVQQFKICPNCKQQMHITYRFCPKCGWGV